MSNLSLKAFKEKIEKEDKVKKRNQSLIEENNKKIKSILDSADNLEIDKIVKWLSSIKFIENDSLIKQSLEPYAKFHQGRASGIQCAIDLLTSIQKKHLNK